MSITTEIPDEHLRPFTNEEINSLPLSRWEGAVKLVSTEGQLTKAVRALKNERLLGFDTETRPVFRKGQKQQPPSLIQLAGPEVVYLFQINVLGFGDGIIDILADPEIVKTGVSVRDDVLALRRLMEFKPAGFVDLGRISARCQMQTHGLRNLAANLLGFRISKGAQCSNWAKKRLTPQQIVYAATDAWVSREIYVRFKDLGAI